MKKLMFVFLCALAMILLMLGYLIKQSDIKYEEYLSTHKHYRADYIFDQLMPQLLTEAKESANSVKLNIVKDLDANYKNRDTLRLELEGVLSGKSQESKALEIIGKSIKGVTLNSVKENTDNNDIIFFAHDPVTNEWKITADYSLNCATDERIRTMEVELQNQFAKTLFSNTYTDITERGREVAIWSFLTPTSEYKSIVENIETLDLDELKILFIRHNEDLSFLKSFEVLVSTRIYEEKDYFGKSTIFAGSKVNDTMNFIVTQGFNINDQLNLKGGIKVIDDKYKEDLKAFAMYKLQIEFFMILVFIIFAILFITAIDHGKK